MSKTQIQLGNVVEVNSDDNEIGIYSLENGNPICFLPKANQFTDENIKFILDSPKMFSLLQKVVFMYSKGIKPSIGFIQEIQTLISKHK